VVKEPAWALEPIGDPWFEEYEARPARRRSTAAEAQGDLYMDAAPARSTRQAPAADPYDDHKKSGWSLFGKKRQAPQASYQAPPAQEPAPQMRTTQSAQVEPDMAEDDLEIPSFLRRLAN